MTDALRRQPAVALTGPRQCGKTTLARELVGHRPSTYLDLELVDVRDRLTEPGAFFADHADRLVIIDEVQRMPHLFEELRGAIDRGRREGRETGRFLLLGSASIDLITRSETLAGRIAYIDLAPAGAGASWEGMAIENLIAVAGDRAIPGFYRTAAGAEIDLVLDWSPGRTWAVEIKRSLSPTPTRGFYSAVEDVQPSRSFVVYPGTERFRVAPNIEAIGLPDLCDELIAQAR